MKKSMAVICVIALLLAGCASQMPAETTQQPTEETEMSLEMQWQSEPDLNGKKLLFVGDSFLFTGRAVLQNTAPEEENRRNDHGYFYQLCKANGMDVSVTNWTYGGKGLQTIMDSYIPLLSDREYDYVILSGGRNSANTIAGLEATLDQYIALFRGVNPKVQFIYLVTSGAHNISVKESFAIDVLNNLEKVEQKGIKVVDWGKLVADIIRGEVQVPGSTKTYDKYSFVHNKSLTDGFHPNQLSGYITALMIYCAITGESAQGQPYVFWNDSQLSTQFDYGKYLNYAYTLGLSNYGEVFESEADMKGLQQLIDRYLAERTYLSYNFTRSIVP